MHPISRWLIPIMLVGLSPLMGGVVACGQLPEELNGIDAILNDAQVDLGLTGYSLLVVRDRRIVYERSFGDIAPDTVIQIASGTKWLSGAVVMALVDNGAITLDDTTGQWLGWTGTKGTITVRQLFSHTSGITSDNVACLSAGNAQLQGCAALIGTLDLITAPGSEVNYGGASMQVAGALCESATATSWVDLFAAELTTPLGMSNTFFASATNPRVAGGMFSTVDDYALFLQMLLDGGQADGGQVLSLSAVDALLADQTVGAVAGDLPPTIQDSFAGYGIGNFVLGTDEAGTVVASTSPGLLGFSPWIDRERNYYAIFAVEDLNTRTDPYVRLLRDEVNALLDAGDLNCDGRWTLDDATSLVGRLVDDVVDSSCQIGNADVNRDGSVDGRDVASMVSRLLPL